jgi:NAD(P)-dependent dehydrogenase (short-subunit alcohol dehydrogenase family)
MIETQRRVALVTGAARGVGARIAEGLVEALVFVMDQVYKSIFGSNKTDRLTLLSSPTPEIRWIAERAERFEARYDALLGAALRLPAWCAERVGVKPRIGINPSGLLWNGGYTGNDQFGLKADFQDVVSKLIESIDPDRYDIVLVPHVLHSPVYHVEDDNKVCRWLGEFCRYFFRRCMVHGWGRPVVRY